MYAGKGSFYSLRYGHYLIGMNTTRDQEYELKVPEGVRQARELAAGKILTLRGPVKVAPFSTVVLYLED